MSTLSILPNLQKKTAKFIGTVSAGEKVSVILKDCASLNTDTLRLRVMFMGKTLAAFPIPAADGEDQEGFAVSGDDLTCTLNLCTRQMLQRFRRVMEMDVAFILDDIAESVRQIYFFGMHGVHGWPQEAGSDVPVDLAGYGDKIAALERSISDIEAAHDADIEKVNASLDGKVDKESGKGLSHVDVTTDTISKLALRSELQSHAEDTAVHVSAEERSSWNNKVAAKQDVIVQDGFLYIPDRDIDGVWRRLQAHYDTDMGGVTTTCGEEAYVRGADGKFAKKEGT